MAKNTNLLLGALAIGALGYWWYQNQQQGSGGANLPTGAAVPSGTLVTFYPLNNGTPFPVNYASIVGVPPIGSTFQYAGGQWTLTSTDAGVIATQTS